SDRMFDCSERRPAVWWCREARAGLKMKYHTAAEPLTTDARAVPPSEPPIHGIPLGMRNKIATAKLKTIQKNAPANIKRRGRLHRPSGSDLMAFLQPPCRATRASAAALRPTPT